MKKYNVLWILLFTALLQKGYSQELTDRTYPWSFGISAGDILHHLFNAESGNEPYAAFVLEYAGSNYALQFGIRPDYNTRDISHEGFSDTEVTKKTALSGSVSLTRVLFADNRWNLRGGLRYAGGWSREDIIDDSGFDRMTTRRLQWNSGGGLVVDFRFAIHPRFSLGTEASLIYSIGHSELQQLFTNFPDFNTTKDVVEDTSLKVIEPATIYLRYHF